MQVVFLGGASAIGASCLAIETGSHWIVVDAGVRVGGTGDPLPDLAFLQEKPVAALLVTHAHADHIGALPLLHAAFPMAPIYATRATCLLIEVMLADSLKIMTRRATEELEVPLYDEEQVASTLERLRSFPVGQPSTLAEVPDLTITATLAGHVAGAVCFCLEAPDGRLVISGDISLTAQRTVPGASLPPMTHPDLLILESTYGRSALHPNRQTEELRLAETVATVIAGGGHCLIPAFALGRAQEALLILLAAQGSKQIPHFPIYIDGLVRRVTSAYMQIPEALNPRLTRAIHRGRQPFSGPTLEYVRDSHHREQIMAGPPACIISSSGMLTGGPSAWYAERLVTQAKSAILITGYQDEESPGRRLLALAEESGGTITFGEETLSVRCQIMKYALSAHADAGELAGFATAVRPDAVALVHGDSEARSALAAHLRGMTIHQPIEGESLDVRQARRPSRERLRRTVPSMSAITLPHGIGQGIPATLADLPLLHNRIHEAEPDRVSITLRELAHVWYPTPTSAFEAELGTLIDAAPHLFMPVVDLPGVYQLTNTGEASGGPDDTLRGQVLLVQISPRIIEPALCLSVRPAGLEVLTQKGYRGHTRVLPADVLEIIGPYGDIDTLDAVPERIKEVNRRAEAYRRRHPRAELIGIIESDRSYSLDEVAQRMGAMREDLSERLAIAHMLNDTPGVVRSMAQWEWGGPGRYSLHPDQIRETDLLSSRHANTAALAEAVDQCLGTAHDLYKRSFDPITGAITLSFWFPTVAERRYATEIAQLTAITGVSVSISPRPHQDALVAQALRDLPVGLISERPPSLLLAQQTIQIRCTGQADEGAILQAQAHFQEVTGWHLRIISTSVPSHSTSVIEPMILESGQAPVPSQSAKHHLSNAELVALSHQFLPDSLGVTKRSVTSDGHLVIGATFPDVAREQWANRITLLQNASGVTVEISGNTNHALLAQAARMVAPLQVRIAKSISIYHEQKRVHIRYEGEATDAEWEESRARFHKQTGWELTVEAIAGPVVNLRVSGGDRLDQNRAIIMARTLLGPETGLYKVSANADQNELVLRFHFPHVADQLDSELNKLKEMTGWDVVIHPVPHLGALEAAARALIPVREDVITTHVAMMQETRQVVVTYRGYLTSDKVVEICSIFTRQTGWRLILNRC
jgi:Cft2 family RNA processing exonuclease